MSSEDREGYKKKRYSEATKYYNDYIKNSPASMIKNRK